MPLCILASAKIKRAPGADLNVEMNHVKPECKDEIRERILRAALVEFSQHGFDAASLNTIAANADITKQLIRYYYGSKESLYKAVLESVSGSMRIVDGVEFFENISPTAAIRALVDELSQASPAFAALWRDNDVRAYGEGSKQLRHPTAGLIAMEFSAFAVDGRPDLGMVVYNPATPEDAEKIRALLASA